MKSIQHVVHLLTLWFAILFGYVSLSGCLEQSLSAGTETGNPGPIIATSEYSSAVPVVFPDKQLPKTFFKAHLDVAENVGSLNKPETIVSPDIFWRQDNMLFVGGADRGLQIIDLAGQGSPVLRGHLTLPGLYNDICLVDSTAYLLTSNNLYTISIADLDSPVVKEASILGCNVIRITPFGSKLLRLSAREDNFTQLDIVPPSDMKLEVSKGLILPIKMESEKKYGDAVWIRGISPNNGKSYLMGINLQKLQGQTELLDLRALISVSSDSPPSPPVGSPIFCITEVPPSNIITALNDMSYFQRIMQTYSMKIMEMFYGIWLEEPTYVVLTDNSLHVYDLNNNGTLAAVVPISFLPESFLISGSTLTFSYFHHADVPKGGDSTKDYGKFFFSSFDLSHPSSPQKTAEINVPGNILVTKNNDLLTIDFSWVNGAFVESLKSCHVEKGDVVMQGEQTLPQRTTNRLASDLSVITVIDGDADNWADLIRIYDLFKPAKPTMLPGKALDSTRDYEDIGGNCGGVLFGTGFDADDCNDWYSLIYPDIGKLSSNENPTILKPNHDYVLHILPTPRILQGTLIVSQPGAASYNSLFTSFSITGNIVGGANDVRFAWDKSLLDATALQAGQEIVPGNATLESSCLFFAFPLIAEQVWIYGPGTYTFDTCPSGDIPSGLDGTQTDGSSICTPGDPSNLITMTVAEGQIGGHALLNWSAAQKIDLINVWDMHRMAYGPMANDCATLDARKVWDLASTDADNDGVIGIPMIDGPFKGFNANFNLMAAPAPNNVTTGNNFTMYDNSPYASFAPSFVKVFDAGINIHEQLSEFGSSIGGDGYVGTIRFTTNADASGFAGTSGTSSDFQFDSIINTNIGIYSQEYRPGETTQNDYMPNPAQLGLLHGTLGSDGTMTIVPDGRIGGASNFPGIKGVRMNVDIAGNYVSFTTEAVTSQLGTTIHGERIYRYDDGTYKVTLVSTGAFGEEYGPDLNGLTYFEVWDAIIVDAAANAD